MRGGVGESVGDVRRLPRPNRTAHVGASLSAPKSASLPVFVSFPYSSIHIFATLPPLPRRFSRIRATFRQSIPSPQTHGQATGLSARVRRCRCCGTYPRAKSACIALTRPTSPSCGPDRAGGLESSMCAPRCCMHACELYTCATRAMCMRECCMCASRARHACVRTVCTRVARGVHAALVHTHASLVRFPLTLRFSFLPPPWIAQAVHGTDAERRRVRTCAS
eukprot:4511904-Pleurochrysis_carterae.AAC.1